MLGGKIAAEISHALGGDARTTSYPTVLCQEESTAGYLKCCRCCRRNRHHISFFVSDALRLAENPDATDATLSLLTCRAAGELIAGTSTSKLRVTNNRKTNF